MTMECGAARKLRECSLIVYDEATMVDRFTLEAIDHLLRDVTEKDEPFGGKVMLLGMFVFSQHDNFVISQANIHDVRWRLEAASSSCGRREV